MSKFGKGKGGGGGIKGMRFFSTKNMKPQKCFRFGFILIKRVVCDITYWYNRIHIDLLGE